MQKCLIEIVFELEIIMIYKFWFNYQSSSGFVDVAMWKKTINTGWYVQIASCHVIEF